MHNDNNFLCFQRYAVTCSVKPGYNRQISTDSRAPMLQSGKGCNILCLTLKRRAATPSSSPEPLKGAYTAVPSTERDTIDGCEKSRELEFVKETNNSCNIECEVPFIDDFPEKKLENNDNSKGDDLGTVFSVNGDSSIKHSDEGHETIDIPNGAMEKKEPSISEDVELKLFSDENRINNFTNCENVKEM